MILFQSIAAILKRQFGAEIGLHKWASLRIIYASQLLVYVIDFCRFTKKELIS
jgi:hypothetical protein